MANPEHVRILELGAEQWNKWRKEHPRVQIDLSGTKLRGADLGGVNLNKANLWGADLSLANLSSANLSGANLFRAEISGGNLHRANLSNAVLSGSILSAAVLSEAELGGADLSRANFRHVDLSGANLHRALFNTADLGRAKLRGARFHGAELVSANLSGADLGAADLTMAQVGLTVFADVDLSIAKGLEAVIHNGPSTVGIDTIYKSRGKIPEVFLRGCGVPDEFIAYIGSMVGRPIEFYSCFISYSTKNQEFAERLHADLQAKGVRCWFAPHDIQGGKKIHEQIDEAIRLHDKLLLILSEDSMKSEWVKTELAKARKREVKDG